MSLPIPQVHFQVPYPILLCTYTNVAVDHLVEGLVAAALTPLRIGYSGKVKASLEEHTLEHRLEAHSAAPELKRLKESAEAVVKRRRALEERVKDVRAKVVGGGSTGRAGNMERRLAAMEADLMAMERQEEAVRAKAYGVYVRMVRDVVTASDVVSVSAVDG